MKDGIHPTYHTDSVVTCSCGNTFTTGSTVKEIQTEICSNCHPFYTGKQKLIDTAGRVDKFKARQAAATKRAEVTAARVNKKDAELAKAQAELQKNTVEAEAKTEA